MCNNNKYTLERIFARIISSIWLERNIFAGHENPSIGILSWELSMLFMIFDEPKIEPLFQVGVEVTPTIHQAIRQRARHLRVRISLSTLSMITVTLENT